MSWRKPRHICTPRGVYLILRAQSDALGGDVGGCWWRVVLQRSSGGLFCDHGETDREADTLFCYCYSCAGAGAGVTAPLPLYSDEERNRSTHSTAQRSIRRMPSPRPLFRTITLTPLHHPPCTPSHRLGAQRSLTPPPPYPSACARYQGV